MEEELDIDELRKLKVVELRERLSELGLPTGGLKADLVERLFTHLKENAEGEEAEEDEEIEEDNDDGEDSPPPLSPEPQQFLQHEDQHQPPPQQQHQMRHMQPPQVPPPPGVRPPSGPPPFAAPPQFGHPRGMPPPPPHMQQQGPLDELQQKVALQNKMIAEEKEQQMKQQQQQLLEQQQKIMQQQQQIIRQQQQQQVLPPGPPRDVELMEKVRQQQLMIEHEKHQELLREQQTKLLETQKQALQKLEEERRQREEEMLRQQQIAVMEAQREEQQKRQQQQQQQQQQHPPGGMQPPMPMGMGQPPVGMGPMPTPSRPQGSIPGGPPPTSAPPGMMAAPGGMMQGPPRPGMPQMMPPQSSGSSNMPPQMMPPMPSPAPSHPHPPGPPPQMSRPQPPPQVQPPHQQQMRLRGPTSQTHGPRPTAPGGPPRNQAPGGPQSPEDEDEEQKEIRLPHALEKILAFKDVRAQEVGLTKEELEELDKPEAEPAREDDDDVEMEMDDIEEDTEKTPDQTKTKESKNKKRKKKKKKTKRNHQQQEHLQKSAQDKSPEEDVQIEYIHEQLDLDPMDPNYFTFARIFEAFKISEPEQSKENEKKEAEKKEEEKKSTTIPIKARGLYDDDDDIEDEDDDEKKPEDDAAKISKKKLKKLTRLSVAQLKQLVSRPDVVEMHDVTAQDPRLLVHLKATRNTVPVPRHWCFKRKYLQGKRGIEKPPFDLPDYIKDTGIMEMRAALQEKEDQKNLKAKMREKVRPKMGKIDIDYQKLHDAFFRHQNKPKMTVHGDLYYEGKEFETKLKEKKPGNLSDDLRTALGMPIGPGAEKVPPPWLIAMQRYGPPPSYPNLKIPGLNGAIPEGCSFGYHAGGWGKPPVDENGKPLYGDVFGTQSAEFQTPVQEEEIDRTHWGEVESESEEEESSEEESEGEEDEMGLVTPAEGMVTPSGITSVPIGMETPDMIELRKKRIEDIMDQGGETPALYTILPEKKTTVGGAMMGSAHIYDISAVAGVPQAKKPGEKVTEGIEVALNPEELDLDTAAMQAKYDQTLREQQSQLEKEDLSDMVAEHAAKQKKRKKQLQDSGKGAKKYREFKF